MLLSMDIQIAAARLFVIIILKFRTISNEKSAIKGRHDDRYSSVDDSAKFSVIKDEYQEMRKEIDADMYKKKTCLDLDIPHCINEGVVLFSQYDRRGY